MVLRRTTVFADVDDLAVLKAAAERRGVAEAELIRDAIHLAALANRVWPDPVFSRSYEPLPGDDGAAAVREEVWADEAARYERTKKGRSSRSRPAGETRNR